MSGPKYRKIALNGRPLPDEKPQNTEETDQLKDETYVDALNLNLRHSVTDVYIPLVGSQLALTVRRNNATQIWSNKTGLTPDLRPDLPFGSCWTAAVAPIAELVHQDPTVDATPCLTLEADYITVTDETGSAFRFLVALLDGALVFLTMPANQLDTDAYQTTLALVDGVLILTKKNGNKTFYEGPTETLVVPADPTDPHYAYTETHAYYRATHTQDRFGVVLTYEGTGLIPDSIVASTGQQLTIVTDSGKIQSITDPNGNTISYTYGDLGLETVTKPEGVVTVYGYQSVFEADPIPSESPTIYVHVDLVSIESGGYTYTFTLDFDHSKWVWDTHSAGYYYKAGEPMWVSSVALPLEGATVTFELLSDMRLVGGGFDFEGFRRTTVTDAEGFVRQYDFTGISVIFMNNLEAQINISEHGNPLRVPKLVVFSTMVVTHVGFGTETFYFELSAGMALSAVTDLCNNTTTFSYANLMPIPSWAVGYPVLYYGDVGAQVRNYGATKRFLYESQWRVMTKIVDEEGRTTDYGLNSLGLRVSETIRPTNGGTAVQQTLFEYTDDTYAAFMTKKTVVRLLLPGGEPADGGPLAASPDLVTRYVKDGAGRVAQEIHETGSGDLVTGHTYDDNSNKLSTTDPNENTTSFEYDGCNRMTLMTFPPTGTPPVAYTKVLSYDNRSNKIQEIDERGFLTQWEFDALNRMTKQRRVMSGISPNDGVDLITIYGYNAVNSRTSVTDPKGNVTTMDYDGLQCHIRTTRPISGDVTTYLYAFWDNAGSSAFDTSKFKPTTMTDPRGFVTQVKYDALYRPIKKWVQYQLAAGEVPALSSYSEMTYDLVGNLIQESHWQEGVSPGAPPPTP